MNHQDKPDVKWRHELPTTTTTPAFEDELPLSTAWLRLQVLHTPFRAMEQEEYRHLADTLRDIELAFLGNEHLRDYYDECMCEEWAPAEEAPGKQDWRVRHVALLQARLLEDAFYILQLDRYANAADNRGWMNLFRRWGRSPSFNYWFDRVYPLFSEEFVLFYDLYLRSPHGPIENDPIPHPWDSGRRRGLPSDETPPKPHRREVTKKPMGVFLDSGIREAGSPAQTERTGEEPLPQSERGEHGVDA